MAGSGTTGENIAVVSGAGGSDSGDDVIGSVEASASRGSVALTSGASTGRSGDVSIAAGSSAAASGGAVSVSGGSSGTGTGGALELTAAPGAAAGGAVSVEGGASTGGRGGNVTLRAGAGETNGAVVIEDADGNARVTVDASGTVSVAGERTSINAATDITLTAGESVSFKIAHSEVPGKEVLSVQGDRIVANVPAHLMEILEPADSTIKRDVSSVNTDSLLQRMQELVP